MISISLNLSNFYRSIMGQVTEAQKRELIKVASQAIAELEQATPVDTGEAASSWSFTVVGNEAILENDAAHIVFLNAGSSDQAPSYFIENIVLKYGSPAGSIVTYK